MEPQTTGQDNGQASGSEPVDVAAPNRDNQAAASPVAPEVSSADSPAPIDTPTASPVVAPEPLTPIGAQPPDVVASNGPAGRPKRWMLLAAIVVVLLLLLGGGYVFGMYLPNRPSSVYATSLQKSGEALDALVHYSNSAAQKGYRSYALKGAMHATGTASFDATLTGALDVSGNSTFRLGADVLGEKLGVNFESVHVSGSATPDLYVQVSGVKQELDNFGLDSLDYLDGQWISIDHTLINSYLASLKPSTSAVTGSSAVPTMQQVTDALTKLQTVNKQYIFTTDSSRAVLANEQFIGHESKDGRAVYHFRVGYNRVHFQDYVSALGTALDNSSLNTWSKAANDGKSLSEVLGVDSLKTSVESAGPGYTFDVWVDAKTKLVHAVQFTDPSDRASTLTISQNYTGGTNYPFAVAFNGRDSATGATAKANLAVTLNTATDVSTGTASIADSNSTSLSSTFTLTPSKNAVQVAAPPGAKSIVDVLAALGLGGDSGL